MINLTRFLPPERIVALKLHAHDEILYALIRRCLDSEAEVAGVLATLSEPRHMKDQPLDHGFAITHARLDRLSDIRVSVGLLETPAAFCRGPRVHTVFCALIPADRSSEYLSFLARLGRLLLTPGAEEAFRSADPARVASFIRTFEE